MTAKTKSTGAESRPKFRNGDVVRFTRRNGEKAEGRVVGRDEKKAGLGTAVWLAVNTAPKGANPAITKIRPSEATRVA